MGEVALPKLLVFSSWEEVSRAGSLGRNASGTGRTEQDGLMVVCPSICSAFLGAPWHQASGRRGDVRWMCWCRRR